MKGYNIIIEALTAIVVDKQDKEYYLIFLGQ